MVFGICGALLVAAAVMQHWFMQLAAAPAPSALNSLAKAEDMTAELTLLSPPGEPADEAAV